jgi:hypothetical protein
MKSSRQFLIEQLTVNSALNFLIAILLGWNTLAGHQFIPLAAPEDALFDPNMASELVVGSFLLGVILTPIVTAITRAGLRKGSLQVNPVSGLIAKLPHNSFFRSLAVALLASLVFGVTSVVILAVVGVTQLPIWTYIVAHAVYMALLALVVTWVAVKRALAEEPLLGA